MKHHIGLIVTGEKCLEDFKVFCSSLSLWHSDAILYVFTDSFTPIEKVPFPGKVLLNKCLDKYKGLNRRMMEQMPGKVYKSLWTDFMYEKANVLEWVFENTSEGAWFLDADICHFQ